MTCDFKSFSTVFQSYQDDEGMLKKDCMQRNPVYNWKDSPAQVGLEPRTARSVGQHLTYWATRASHLGGREVTMWGKFDFANKS